MGFFFDTTITKTGNSLSIHLTKLLKLLKKTDWKKIRVVVLEDTEEFFKLKIFKRDLSEDETS